MSEVDYRSGPMELWKMARGELLGPVVSKWPDRANKGKFLKYYHQTPNGVEDAQITTAQIKREELGWSMIFILRARDANGELIYKPSELDTVRTQYPPGEIYRICQQFEAQCEGLAEKVSDGDLGNSSKTIEK